MKIKKLITKDAVQVELGHLNVLVGPNNVGKSQLLRDIHDKFEVGDKSKTIIIESLEFEQLTYDQFLGNITTTPSLSKIDMINYEGLNSMLRGPVRFEFDPNHLKNQFPTDSTKISWNFLFERQFGKLKIAYLDSDSRLQIAKQAESKPREEPPQNLLQALFDKKELDKDLLEAFREAFDKEIKLDYSSLRNLIFRISNKFEEIPKDPRDAFDVFDNYSILDKQGDGFRSFVGVVLGLLLSEGRVILIDEPEAFLHPTQARVLGSWISRFSKKSKTQIIIATHSSNILDGLLSEENDIHIIRVNRHENSNTFKKIAAEITSKLAKSPLLSSQPVQESIFYNGVVVCEGDSDRCIYEMAYSKNFRERNLLFIHAYNKQTIKEIVNILKEASIPVSSIVDMDILDSKNDLEELISAHDNSVDSSINLAKRKKISDAVNGVSEEELITKLKTEINLFHDKLSNSEITDLDSMRRDLKRIRNEISKWENVKKNGILGLPSSVQDDAKDLITDVKNIGIFIVPVGELESWLDLGTSNKKKWVVDALNALETQIPPKLSEFVQSIGEFIKKSI